MVCTRGTPDSLLLLYRSHTDGVLHCRIVRLKYTVNRTFCNEFYAQFGHYVSVTGWFACDIY